MAITKIFKCDNCEASGKIIIKGNELTIRDVVCCPVCGADIFEDEDLDDE